MMVVVLCWLLAVVGIAQAVFATRAYRLEKREGLPRSQKRFAGTLVIAVLLVGLGVVATLQSRTPTATAPVATQPTAPATKPDAAAQAKLDELTKQIAELQKQIDGKRAEIAKLDPGAAAALDATQPTMAEAAPASPWPALAAVALVIVGFALLTLGDLSTLFPKKTPAHPTAEGTVPDPANPTRVPDEPATVANLVAHASNGRWKQGAAVGARIQIEQLHKLEMLDFLYTRALCTAMTVIAPEDGKAVGSADKAGKLADAGSDLTRLLELAPHMAEARYLLGYIEAARGEHQAGLDHMRAAKPELGSVREFARDESVCLLSLAEQKLAAADNDAATRLFDEVSHLGVLVAQIPVAMVTHRILTVRGQIKAGKFAEAADGIARIRQIQGLDAEAQRATMAACDVYDVAVQFRSGKLEAALEANRTFFQHWLPQDLPAVEDQVADEFLLPAIDKKTLPLPADLYRGLFFLEAVCRVSLAGGRPLVHEQIDDIRTALLRALQFQPRHRESLAALAALYLAYRKELTEKALAWLDAAVVMGVRSPKAHGLLAEARRAEVERKEMLALFRSAAGRFLADPGVGVAIRQALIEELGRFDEFRPVVLDLQSSGALDAAPVSDVTLTNLRERAQFVGGVASEVLRKGDPAGAQRLTELQRELASLTANVDTSATRIAALERQVMEQLGKLVLR